MIASSVLYTHAATSMLTLRSLDVEKRLVGLQYHVDSEQDRA